MTSNLKYKLKPKPKPDNIDKLVGINIRKFRLHKGFAMQQLASAIDISHQQIQKYEAGLNRTSAGNLWKISQFLEIPIHCFYTGNLEKSDEVYPKSVDNKRLKQFIFFFMKLKDKNLEHHAVTNIKALAQLSGKL